MLKAYTAIWALSLAAAVAMLAIGAWQGFRPFEYGWLNYGLTTDARGSHVTAVTSAEALARGISPGDAILAIDGRAMDEIGTSFEAQKRALARREGESIAFTFRDAAGQTATHRLTRSSGHTHEVENTRRFGVAATLLSSLAFLVAAVLLFRRRREPVPALLALAFTLTAITSGNEASWWLDAPRLTDAISVAGVAFLLLGLLAFPDGRMGSRTAWAAAAAIALLPVLVLADVAANGSKPVLVTLLALFAAVLARLVLRFRRMPAGIARQQVRWGFFGFAVGIGWLIVSAALFLAVQLPGSGRHFALFVIASTVAGLLATLFMVGGLLVSLMRYRLYDADAVIGRSATYGVLTLGFVALFAGSESLIEKLGEAYLGGQIGALAGGLAAALAAALIVPLHHRVDAWAERRFQKPLLQLSHGLPELVGDLRETARVERIAEAVAEAARAGVQAMRAALIVEGEVLAARGLSSGAARDWLQGRDISGETQGAARGDPLFPMRLPLQSEATGPVGWLVLGPRPDGSLYGKDERKALAAIAGPVARAIDVARSRERREAELMARISRLEAIVVGRSGEANPAAAA